MLVAVGTAALIRIALALASFGSNDANIWWMHATNVRLNGLSWTYAHSVAFNHPPLVGLWAAACQALWPHNQHAFSVALKIPAILGDSLSCFLIGRIWTARSGPGKGVLAGMSYAVCPLMILVSGFHGNTDCLFAALTLCAAWALTERRSPFGAGLALGAALNVKLIPAMLVLPLLLQCRTRKDALRYIAGLALCVIPVLPFLVTEPSVLYRNMVAYSSNLENWGFTFFLLEAKSVPALSDFANAALPLWETIGRNFVLCAPIAIGVWARRRRWSAYQLAAMSYAVFLVAAPGFGIQYLAALPPVLFASSLGSGIRWSALAALFAGLVYFAFHLSGFPWASTFTSRYPIAVALVGVVVWTSTVGLFRLASRPLQPAAH